MSSIQPKQGACIDCAKVTSLIAGRCSFHYWKYREQLKAADRKAKGKDVDAYAEQQALDKWFQEQIAQMPACCENCDAPLIKFAPWAAKAYIAHILPKRTFISVKLHPLNRVFLCVICHTNFDNWGWQKVIQMRVFALAVERLAEVCDSIDPDERKLVPGYLVEAVGGQG